MSSFSDDLSRGLAGLASGRWRVRIPQAAELFRRRPRAFFHATPEVFLQMGGATDFECPRDRFRLRTREICVMPTGVPHAETPIDLRTPYGITVCMQTRDGFVLHRARAGENREIVAVEAGHVVSQRARGAFRYLDELAAEPARRELRHQLVTNLLSAFLITLIGELNQPAATGSARSPLVSEAEKLARSLLGDPSLSVAGLAKVLGCSADHLSRSFHREAGRTLVSWITAERVAQARSLLEERRCNIAEVGWSCGFQSASYFIRVFRGQTGLTPREYRHLHT